MLARVVVNAHVVVQDGLLRCRVGCSNLARIHVCSQWLTPAQKVIPRGVISSSPTAQQRYQY